MKHLRAMAVGDKYSGKTKLLIAYTTNAYPDDDSHLFLDGYSANIILEGFPPVNLQIWEAFPNEEFKKTRPITYPGNDVFLFCFSLVRPYTLDTLEKIFLPEINEICPDVPKILVGTELDLRDGFEEYADEYRSKNPLSYIEPIPTSKGEEFAKKIGAAKYHEVSAFKFINLDVLFDDVVRVVFQNQKKEEKQEKTKSDGGCCEIF